MEPVRISTVLLAIAASAAVAAAQTGYRITTIAGFGDCGDGGPAAMARLGAPEGLAVDAAGNLYIADALDHRVRKISPDGVVTTVAGTGRAGFRGDGGPATAARLNAPYGLAVDSGGNLYIADLGNARIRKVSTEGIISTVAGGDGEFVQPRDLAIDVAGNLYISDFGGHSVYRLTPGGVLSRIAGTGSAGSVEDDMAVNAAFAPLNSPAGLAVDRFGALYIADSGNHRVRKVVNGILTTVPYPEGVLNTPTGIAFDAAGSLHVADKGTSAVWKFAPVPVRVAGTGFPGYSGDGGPATEARFNQPRAIVFDPTGHLYIADTNSGVGLVRRVSPSGVVEAFAGGREFRPAGDNGPALAAHLEAPTGLALDGAGNLYVADRAGHRVRKISSGIITTAAGIGYAGSTGDTGFAIRAQVDGPEGVAVDAEGGLWITEAAGGRIRRVDSGGYISTMETSALQLPSGIAVDSERNIYVADTAAHTVRRIAPDGSEQIVAGTGAPGYAGDGGPAASALLKNPAGLCLDAQGNLYIADSGNHAVRRVTKEGTITTVAGRGEPSSDGDGGPAAAAGLNAPAAVAVDSEGSLYIADTGNNRIRRVDARSVIETIAGTGASGYAGEDAPALEAEFDGPAGIAVDAAGVVYVADRGNGLIRMLTPVAMPPPEIEDPPALSVAAVVNSASMLPGAVAPGQIATLFGTALDSAEVLFEGEPAALLYSGSTQINLVVPQAVAGREMANVEVRTPAGSLRMIVPVAPSNPGIFTLAWGTGPAAAENEDGTLNSADNPAARGSALTIYATGEGSASPLAVEIGGRPAAILSAGHTAGLLRVTVRVPDECSPGEQPVVLRAGGVPSQAGVTVAIR